MSETKPVSQIVQTAGRKTFVRLFPAFFYERYLQFHGFLENFSLPMFFEVDCILEHNHDLSEKIRNNFGFISCKCNVMYTLLIVVMRLAIQTLSLVGVQSQVKPMTCLCSRGQKSRKSSKLRVRNVNLYHHSISVT